MKWYHYRNGGFVSPKIAQPLKRKPLLHLAAGGVAYIPTGPAAPITVEGGAPVEYAAPTSNPYIEAGALDALDYDATHDYYNGVGFEATGGWEGGATTDPTSAYTGPIGEGSELYTPEQIELLNQPSNFFEIEAANANLAEAAALNPNIEVPTLGATVEEIVAAGNPAAAPGVVDHAGTAPVVDIDLGPEELIQLDNTVPTAPVVGGGVTAPPVVSAPPVTAAPPAYVNPVAAYGGAAGVNTGIPQGGFARPAINAYLSGANAPAYQQSITDQLGAPAGWGSVDEEALDQYKEEMQVAAQTAADEGWVAEHGTPTGWSPSTNALSAQEYQQQLDTIANEFDSIDEYDPTKTFEEQLSPEEYAEWQEMPTSNPAVTAADTIYMNNLANNPDGAQAGGLWSGITGKGDDWGSSLTTGAQSNVGLQDRAIALGETVGQFSPLVGAVTDVASDRVAPKNQFQKDARTAQEVSIDRHTKRWQDSNNDDDGPHMTHQEILDAHALQRNKDLGYDSTPSQSAAKAGFDMNDPSTWLQEEDKVDLKSKGSSQSDNDDGGGGGGGGGK